jgi:hypothetical protein
MNARKDKIIKLYVLRPYGYGWDEYKGKKEHYVNYFLEDLAKMLIEQNKVESLDKWLGRGKVTAGNRH